MPSAAAFIGGGLLQGVGKGIATQAIETGKAKRERALADLKHTRGLERDEKKAEGRQGLLDTRLLAEKDAADLKFKGDKELLTMRLDAGDIGGASSQPATVKEAQFLMDHGIAKTWDDAWKMASEGSYSPQKIYQNTWARIYTEQLRNFASEADAKSAADSGAAALMGKMESMFRPGGTGVVEPPPKAPPAKERSIVDRASDFLFGDDEPDLSTVPSTLTPSPASPAPPAATPAPPGREPLPQPQAAPAPASAPAQTFDPATAKYEAVSKDGKTRYYSMDGQTWFFEDGRPVAQ